MSELSAIYFVTTSAKTVQDLEAAPALFLDHSEELRMGLSDEQLISEAIECNHASIGPTTLKKYEDIWSISRPARCSR